MNKTTEALKLAGKALGRSQQHLDLYHPEWVTTRQQNDKALAAIREVLAEPVKQDPVGEVVLERMGVGDAQIVRFQMYGKIPPVGTKLYAAPVSAKREWVDLTDEEIEDAVGWTMTEGAVLDCRAVIAAFKEKNK